MRLRSGAPLLVGAAVAAFPSPLARATRPFRCQAPVPAEVAYQCLGAEAGARVIARALATPKPGPSLDKLARLAARLDATDAVPPLRALIEAANARAVAPPASEAAALAAAARALADLGATAAAPALAMFVRREEGGNATAWEAATRALGDLDAPAALIYARQLAGRVGDLDDPWAQARARLVAETARANAARDLLPTLAKWMHDAKIDSVKAELAEARLALDDPNLRPVRRNLGTRDAPVPPGVARYLDGMGGFDDDVPALLRFASLGGREALAAYEAMFRLLARSTAVPTVAAARTRLRAGLEAQTAAREDRAGPQFDGRLLALHHGVLAALGQGASRRRLVELVEDPAAGPAAWEAARWAVEYRVPGAGKPIAALVARGAERNQPAAGDPELRIRLLSALSADWGKRDPRWALFLLASDPDVRAAALARFVREKPAACEVVTAAARRAGDDAIHDGLLALTALGPACTDALRRLLGDSAAPVAARGTALEVLSMLGSVSPADANLLATTGGSQPYRARAAEIAAGFGALTASVPGGP